MTDLVRTVTIADLANMLQQKGFRAEPAEWDGGREALRSAAGGVGFNIVAGNGSDGAYHDFTYYASFRLEGLPLEAICEKWNAARAASGASTAAMACSTSRWTSSLGPACPRTISRSPWSFGISSLMNCSPLCARKPPRRDACGQLSCRIPLKKAKRPGDARPFLFDPERAYQRIGAGVGPTRPTLKICTRRLMAPVGFFGSMSTSSPRPTASRRLGLTLNTVVSAETTASARAWLSFRL